jgi:hypothetical protein
MRAALLLALLPLPAFADCAPDEALFHCQIGRKTLQVCAAGDRLTYDFGPAGKPELSLSVRLAEADFTPWPGIGRTIWDEIAFYNDGATYRVWVALEKQLDPEEPEPELQGGVHVSRGGADLANLTCNPGSVLSLLDTIHDLKTGIGQCYDRESLRWQACN